MSPADVALDIEKLRDRLYPVVDAMIPEGSMERFHHDLGFQRASLHQIIEDMTALAGKIRNADTRVSPRS